MDVNNSRITHDETFSQSDHNQGMLREATIGGEQNQTEETIVRLL